jgi:hypothetical protein
VVLAAGAKPLASAQPSIAMMMRRRGGAAALAAMPGTRSPPKPAASNQSPADHGQRSISDAVGIERGRRKCHNASLACRKELGCGIPLRPFGVSCASPALWFHTTCDYAITQLWRWLQQRRNANER